MTDIEQVAKKYFIDFLGSVDSAYQENPPIPEALVCIQTDYGYTLSYNEYLMEAYDATIIVVDGIITAVQGHKQRFKRCDVWMVIFET